LAYYATTGTTLSGLTTANNGVLVTDGSGVPSISTTLPSNLLIKSTKIGLILDTNANGMLKLSPISSSVNYFEFKNAATAGTPIITLTGTDSNIPLKLLTIGTGQLSLQSAHATQPILIASGTGLQHVTSLNFSNTSASRDVTFPDATGTLLMTGVAINSVPSITFSSTSGIIGTTTNDSAAAGSVGEYVESVLGSGSAVSLSNGTGTNITSISLTAGDWDFWGQYNVTFNSTTVYTRQGGQISTTSGTIVSTGSAAPTNDVTHPSVTSGGEILFNPIGMGRISLSGTTTLYLNTRCFFSVSTATAYGFLAARRRR
jgi:hypothetical protein